MISCSPILACVGVFDDDPDVKQWAAVRMTEGLIRVPPQITRKSAALKKLGFLG